MDNNLDIENNFSMDPETELEEKQLEIFLGFAYLAVWILSIIILFNLN